MRHTLPLLLLLAACGSSGTETSLGRMGGAPPTLVITSDLIAANGARLGDAIVTEEAQGDRIVIQARGVPEGRHPVTLHSTGTCAGPDFASAGPEFASLPPLASESSGRAELYADLPAPRLRATTDAMLDADGLAVIVSFGGQRIACAAIRYRAKTGAIDGD